MYIRLGIIFRHLYYLKSSRVRKIIFSAFISPVLDYGITIWSSVNSASLIKLNKIYNRIYNLLRINTSSDIMSLNNRIYYFDLKYLHFYFHQDFSALDSVLYSHSFNTRFYTSLRSSIGRLTICKRPFPFRLLDRPELIPEELFYYNETAFSKFIKIYVLNVTDYFFNESCCWFYIFFLATNYCVYVIYLYVIYLF